MRHNETWVRKRYGPSDEVTQLLSSDQGFIINETESLRRGMPR